MTPLRRSLRRHRWLTFVLPLAVFVLVGVLEPTPTAAGGTLLGLAIPYAAYPAVYTAKIVLTTAAILLVWPGLRQFPFRLSWLSIVVGILGVVVWVGLCALHLESKLLAALGLQRWIEAAARSGFNPLEELRACPAWAYGFLAIRFFGLAIVVAIAEELFLRGFFLRLLVDPEWWNVPFGRANRAAIVAGTLVPMLMHPPSELLATAAWFSLVTWLMLKTRNLWDCIAAHATTNLLLGIYVVTTGRWELM